MEAQPSVGSQQKNRSLFPQWVRYVVLTIMVIAILACGAIWLMQVWGHLSDIFAALFGIVGVLFGLLALPVFYSSREAESPANSGSAPQFQNTIHIHLSDNRQPSPTEDRTPAPFSVSVDNEQQDQSPRPAQYAAPGSPSVPHVPGSGLKKPATKLKNMSKGVKLQLDGQQRAELRDVLFQAFPDQTEFNDMLQINFNERLNGLVNVNQNYKRILFDLLGKTQAEGWTEALIKAAYDSNPGNEMLGNYYLTYVENRKAQPIVETDREAGQTTPGNLGENNDTGDPTIKASEEDLPGTRRGCVVEAQEYAKKAYDLLNPKLNILPENVADAIQYLKTVKRDIEQLKALVKADPPPKYPRIFAEIDIVIDQIDNHLTPSLQSAASPYKNAQNKFQALLDALDNLDPLIPR